MGEIIYYLLKFEEEWEFRGRYQTNKLTMENNYRIRGTTPWIQQAAKRLRQNMTPAEITLWSALKGKKLDGSKFRRQHPVGNFILDFYCPAYKLVIEVDGEIHNYQTERDRARTSKLEDYGHKVIRFSNEQVLNDLPGVLAEIRVISPP